MNYTFTVPALNDLDTPVLICNSKGVVIYKNPAAMRTIRLPRRNTSVRSHLGQAEIAEVERIGERKKPSILTLHTGDRPVRALVTSYRMDENSGPALGTSSAVAGEVCSLWVFPAVLQVYASTAEGRFIESTVTEIAPELCKLVKEADRLSGLLPGRRHRELKEKMNRRIGRVFSSFENLPEGRWYDIATATGLLLPVACRRMELVGAHLEYSVGNLSGAAGLAVDFPRFGLQLLYLLIYCVFLSGSRSATVRLDSHESGIEMTASFTLRWPPFTTEETDDCEKLCQLFPGGQIDLLLLCSLCKHIGRGVCWSLSDEAENNLQIKLDLPVAERSDVRMSLPTVTDLLFLERDVEAIFGVVLEARFMQSGGEEE